MRGMGSDQRHLRLVLPKTWGLSEAAMSDSYESRLQLYKSGKSEARQGTYVPYLKLS